MKIILLAFISTAFAGSFVGNSADRHGPHSDEPWFATETVHWCSPQATELEASVQSAVAQWREYMKQKQIPGALTMELVTCDGKEDLRVESGADGAVGSLSYSVQNQHRIWLSRELSAAALTTQLLHQLGHVLGNEHIPGTVMAETIPQSPEVIPTIDGARELYLCRSCDFSVQSAQGTYSESRGHASVTGANRFTITFVTDLGDSALNESRVFGSLRSRGLSRLALIGDVNVVVQRNFDNLVEIRELKSGKILFEAP
jgi:hypothetical protein